MFGEVLNRAGKILNLVCSQVRSTGLQGMGRAADTLEISSPESDLRIAQNWFCMGYKEMHHISQKLAAPQGAQPFQCPQVYAAGITFHTSFPLIESDTDENTSLVKC